MCKESRVPIQVNLRVTPCRQGSYHLRLGPLLPSCGRRRGIWVDIPATTRYSDSFLYPSPQVREGVDRSGIYQCEPNLISQGAYLCTGRLEQLVKTLRVDTSPFDE